MSDDITARRGMARAVSDALSFVAALGIGFLFGAAAVGEGWLPW